MSGVSDIRTWAQEKGIDLATRGRIPAEIKAAYDAEHEGVVLPEGETMESLERPPALETMPAEPAPEQSAAAAGERAPAAPAGKGWRKWRDKVAGAADTGAPRRRRAGIDGLIGHVWDFAASVLTNPVTWPVGNVLRMQAPVAGVIADEVLAGTMVDRILQPLARLEERGSTVFALVGPPVLVGAIVQSEGRLYESLRPMLRRAMVEWVLIAGPALKKAKAKEERLAAELGDLDIDEMIDALFKPPTEAVVMEQADAPVAV